MNSRLDAARKILKRMALGNMGLRKVSLLLKKGKNAGKKRNYWVSNKRAEGSTSFVTRTNRGTIVKRSKGLVISDDEISIAKLMGDASIGAKVLKNGKNYIEMEDLSLWGETIKSKGSLTENEKINLFETIVNMHRRGVVNGDLHNDNVFIMWDDSSRIIDFGEASQFGADNIALIRDVRFAIRNSPSKKDIDNNISMIDKILSQNPPKGVFDKYERKKTKASSTEKPTFNIKQNRRKSW